MRYSLLLCLLLIGCATVARNDPGLQVADEKLTAVIEKIENNPNVKLSKNDIKTIVKARDEIRNADKNVKAIIKEKRDLEQGLIKKATWVLYAGAGIIIIFIIFFIINSIKKLTNG